MDSNTGVSGMYHYVFPGEQVSAFEPSTQHSRCKEERLDRQMNGLNHRLGLERGEKQQGQPLSLLLGRSAAETAGYSWWFGG